MDNSLTTTQASPLDYVTEIERDPRLASAHSRRQYRHALDAFEVWRAGAPLTKTLVEEYAAILQKQGYAPATINAALACIRWWARRVADLAFERADSETSRRVADLAARIVTVEGVRGSRSAPGRHIPTPEIAALLEGCRDGTSAGARDAALIAVATSTGARNTELRNLELTDITYTPEGAELLIRHGKGNKERIAYLFNGALAALDAWLDVRGAAPGYIFNPIQKNGKVITSRNMTDDASRKLLKRRFLASHLSKRLTWHDFRRTFIGSLLDGGTDLATAQELAGHSSPVTTSAYDRRPADRRRIAVKTIEVPYQVKK